MINKVMPDQTTDNASQALPRLAYTMQETADMLGAGYALALWTAHANCFELFVCSPRLNISSPEKGCGKTGLFLTT